MMTSGTMRERHVAIVTNNEDDESRGRIKVACAGLMGVDTDGEPIEYPVWVEPSFPHLLVSEEESGVVDSGFFFVPNVGTAVEIEITVSSGIDKSPGQSSIGNPDPRWVACLLLPGDELSEDFTTNYPNRMGWRSRKGSLLMFDDTDGEERTLLRGPSNGDGEHSFVSMEPDGSMLVSSNLGHLMIFAKDGSLTINDNLGNVYSTSKSGVEITTDVGSSIKVGTTIQIVASGDVTVDAVSAKINANQVALGNGAVESVIKGNTFQALFNAHTHIGVGNLGAPVVTLPPVVPLTGAELSLVTKTA